MQRINTTDHQFHDGDPFNQIQGTAVTAAFLNSTQEEIAFVIEAESLVLDPLDNTQLYQALLHMLARLAFVESKPKRYFFGQF
ncbi:hypothetical protein [Undibacterium sp. Ren11W]|uniref:hypothetical protein n=1 Tax=Undibacterium sp. Ren11W TaxID=3413045 RepID=UPI003BF162DB